MALHTIVDRHRSEGHIYPFQESVGLLRAVGRGEEPSMLRLYRPAKNMAFGRRDELNPRFADARAAAAAHGYQPLVRPVGGHAAGYHSGCLVVDHFQSDRDAISGNTDRFETFGKLFQYALTALGVKAGVGEIAGEYCPGLHSVHAYLPSDKPIKIVGTAQRVVAGAWWMSAGIVVDHSDELRAVTHDVYRALDLDLDPRTVGALTDIDPELTVDDVEDAIFEAYSDVGWGRAPGYRVSVIDTAGAHG